MASDRQPNRAGSHQLFTAGSGRTRGRGTSRIALLLSLMLVAGALAVPAFAVEDGPVEVEILSPVDGEFVSVNDVVRLRATADPSDSISWALRWMSSDRDNDYTLAGNVDGQTDVADFAEGNFSFDTDFDDLATRFEALDRPDEGDSPDELVPGDEFFFVFNPTNRSERLSVQFSILEDVETVACESGNECTTGQQTGENGQGFTASTTDVTTKLGNVARMGIRTPGSGADPAASGIADSVHDACNALLEGTDLRLGGDVAQLVPLGFKGGDITVQMVIPRSVINSDVNRGNPAFQVCIAPTESEEGAYVTAGYDESEPGSLDDTGLVGPILLDDCESDDQTACVESRERISGANLVITYRIPAVDPWMM